MLNGRSRKVVLFQPPYAGRVFGPPLGLLSLAASLREAGYQPLIVDGALGCNFANVIEREISDCGCFGVSLLTGPMIHDAIAMSRLVRERRPDMPVIFGGWHPSLMPGQTLREEFVDIVVRHQGEKTLVEILDRLESGKPLDMVAGCWFKRGGKIFESPDRPAAALSSLPSPAYDLVDFDAYQRVTGVRKLPYATSIGCPYACNYCTDMVFYSRRFNASDTARVVAQVTALAARHNIEEMALVDSNFLVDHRRAIGIARGFAVAGARFRWTFQASTDLLCRMSDADVRLLAASGVSHIGFGTESADPEILRSMNKHHQRIADIDEAARKCAQAGIRTTLNLIFGYPGEEDQHRRETLRVMGGIASRFENVTFSPNLFTPYPGIPIWPDLIARGLREPDSLASWAAMDLGGAALPWLRGRPLRNLQRAISYFLLDNHLKKIRWRSKSRIARFMLKAVRRPLDWRLRHYSFAWPLELWLSMANRWLVMRRSLLTGQPLGHKFKPVE